MTANEIVATFRNSLNRFHDEASQYLQSQGTDPGPSSTVAQELAAYPRPESVASVTALASFLIESVAEHVTLFVKSITEPVEPIACWTCVRSMLESASIAAWLLDPGIDAQTRVGRHFALRYEGMVQEIKLHRAMNAGQTEVQALERRIVEVENIAYGLGFKRIRDGKNKITGIGQRALGATEMIEQVLDEGVAYRLLSAVAHGHHWAIRQLSFTPGPAHLSPTGGPTLIEMTKHSGTLQGYGFLTSRVAKSFALPLWNQCLYFGWDRDRLEKILESVYDEFNGLPGTRFWRKAEPTK